MIFSEHIYIRELDVSDVDQQYVDWLNDPEVNRYMEVRHSINTYESCCNFVELVSGDSTAYLFGIFLKSDGRHIGNIKLGFIDWRYKTGQISFFIGDKSFWGKGFASEAISLVSKFGFTELGLERIEAGCYESNLSSLKTLMRCGYSVEGFFRKSFILDGRRESCFWLAILKSEFVYGP
ncbi:GNAT family N-acetyltransferase [Pseudomonas sp. EA_35y_Pfl2_R5]|uniref:GNAT family N-acetyltransferase n=1 Tax=Pseudomonas sp. EA_35y_Pfl2_R5 TaxID=3088690 RepID=UPI0030D9F619